MLGYLKQIFVDFVGLIIHGNTSYVVLYTQCLRYNICSVWFLDIRYQLVPFTFMNITSYTTYMPVI